jgi:hypothetical protein
MARGNVIGASDRMLTSGLGDIEFEPQVSKLQKLTDNVCVMIAGDMTLQTEIIYKVMETVPSLPGLTWTVEEVANAYYKAYQECHRKRAEWAILHPLGLADASSVLLMGDPGMRVASDLINFKAPQIEALVTGYDDRGTGAHIYVVTNFGITCHDWVGFASIGGGSGHANSQFMFAGHNRYRALPETLMLVYSAKKRAEIAPGVGSATDMFFIEPPGTFYSVGTHVLEQLDECYQQLTKNAADAMEAANGKISQYIETITKASESTASENTASVPALPFESEGLSGADKPESSAPEAYEEVAMED